MDGPLSITSVTASKIRCGRSLAGRRHRDEVGRAAARSPSLLMAQHGLIASAPSLDAAVDLAEELEAAAQVFFLLRGTGLHGYEARPLTAQQRAEL